MRNAQVLLNKEDIPSERQWMTIDEKSGLEFQPGSNDESDPRMKHIRRSLGFGNGMQTDMANGRFVDGAETYYDEYAQAWRVLGFYLDCDACSDEGEDANANGYNGNCYAYENGGYQNRCQRYLLWAAVCTNASFSWLLLLCSNRISSTPTSLPLPSRVVNTLLPQSLLVRRLGLRRWWC